MEQLFLFGRHLPGPLPSPLMLIPQKVKNAMNHQEDDHLHAVKTESIRLTPGGLYRNGQIPQKVGM